MQLFNCWHRHKKVIQGRIFLRWKLKNGQRGMFARHQSIEKKATTRMKNCMQICSWLNGPFLNAKINDLTLIRVHAANILSCFSVCESSLVYLRCSDLLTESLACNSMNIILLWSISFVFSLNWAEIAARLNIESSDFTFHLNWLAKKWKSLSFDSIYNWTATSA